MIQASPETRSAAAATVRALKERIVTVPLAGVAPVPKVLDPREFELDGLYLAGQVRGRIRRTFDSKGGGKRYMIALTILTADGLFRPERWCEHPSPSDIPVIGDHVCLKVNLNFFTGKNGQSGARLTWGSADRGEEF